MQNLLFGKLDSCDGRVVVAADIDVSRIDRTMEFVRMTSLSEFSGSIEVKM